METKSPNSLGLIAPELLCNNNKNAAMQSNFADVLEGTARWHAKWKFILMIQNLQFTVLNMINVFFIS